jgi:TonB-linked SusC/RagA family outer membrane protein
MTRPRIAALLLLLGAPGVHAQDLPGSIAGRVTDARTGAALVGAAIEVRGSRLRATTDADGRYEITRVPAGTHVVLARRVGYAAAQQPVTVVEDQRTTVDFALKLAAVPLDAIVVTGTAGGEQRRAIGNAVGTIDAGEVLERSAAPTLGSLLAGRAAGVIVTPGTGRLGAGQTLQLRGRSTLSLSGEPIVYIDGVRVNNDVNQGSPGAPGTSLGSQNAQVASRLNDIDPESIERIEIIKGPAAATTYGTEGANGVIQIFTKKGGSGRAQWTAKIEQGSMWFANPAGRIPVNYAIDTLTGQPVAWRPIEQEQARGTPIFRNGRTQSYNLSLSGATEALTYYLSGTYNDDQGIEPNNFGTGFSGHASLGVTPSDKVQVSVSTHYFRGAAHLGADGGVSPMLGMSIGHAINNPATRGFAFTPPEVPQQLYDNAQDINRYTAGVTVNHRPTPWFAQRLVIGLDYTSDDSRTLERYAPPELRSYLLIFGPSIPDGRIGQTLRNNSFITSDYSGTATFTVTPTISSASSIGWQFTRRQLKSNFLSGTQFPAPGVETVSGTSTPGPATASATVNTTIGVYGQQRFGVNDRLFVTGAVRLDDNSAFGENFNLVTYPKVSATWVMSEEPFWGGASRIASAVKLRAAYGQSGQQPAVSSALQTFTNAPRANGTPGVTPGTFGNPDLKPERGTELEVGFEAALFDRLSLDFTYYTKRTRDAILARNLPPSGGFPGTQFVNIGETSNRGVELLARLHPIVRENLSWEIAGNISTNRDRVEDVGGATLSPGTVGAALGYPILGFWTKRIASADRDPVTHAISNILCVAGPAGGAPVACSAALPAFVGTATPKLLGSISSTLTFRRVTVYALVDFKRGHRILNANDANRCSFNVCEARFFPERYSTAYLAAIQQSSITAGVLDPFIQDASFTKLREVSVRYELPASWLGPVRGISGAAITLAGRNLAVWSPYNGIDPEVQYQGTTPQDQGLVPALTQFIATLNLRF